MAYEIDDMEHQVRKIIAQNREVAGFPQLDDYGVSEDEFDDYLFYKQAVIDDVDSLRRKYTVYSVIFILPFVVMAFFKTTITNSLIAMGIGFGAKTLYCIAMSSLAMQIVSGLTFMHCIPGEFFFVRETLLIPVIAGVLEAVGIGLVIRYGGSTGGTDIVALMINKYWPVSLSTAFFVLDFVVVSLLLLLPDKVFADACYGLVEIVTFMMIIDLVVGGNRSSYQLMVFSEKYEQIADHIVHKMERGVTVLKAMGWYTKNDKNVLVILISQKEFPALSKVIKEIDPKAFMSVSPTHNVYGEGFDEIKTGIKTSRKKNAAD